MDWFSWENLWPGKPLDFPMKIMGLSGVNFPVKTNPLRMMLLQCKTDPILLLGIRGGSR